MVLNISENSSDIQVKYSTGHCSWRFLISNKLEQLEIILEKLLGFRNMQEKLEK
jgi:hypothetical protein